MTRRVDGVITSVCVRVHTRVVYVQYRGLTKALDQLSTCNYAIDVFARLGTLSRPMYIYNYTYSPDHTAIYWH